MGQSPAMSEANVAAVRRGYEAIARGDLEAIAEILAPDVKWHGGDEFAQGACRGSSQALAFMRAAIDRGRVGELVDVIDAGDQVVVVLQPPASGSASPPQRANVTTFRDGKVVEMVAYESPADALAATRR
jgi:ketosteroid isomerase-like protein